MITSIQLLGSVRLVVHVDHRPSFPPGRSWGLTADQAGLDTREFDERAVVVRSVMR
ncbi:hypothetical protein ACWD9K_17800 [Streptomyces sp. 900116325]